MGHLIDFFKRNLHYFLLVILIILGIILIDKNMSYDGYRFARFCQNITNPIQKTWSGILRRFRLTQENEALIQQNITLMREHENMFISKEDTTFSRINPDVSPNSTTSRLYDYTYAHVIYNTVGRTANYIIIDKGTEDGICKDMAAISTAGVVGVVSDVSRHFATILPILHPISQISSIVQPANQLGALAWGGKDPQIAYLQYIPQHLEINIGDSVFTSGYSNIFPKGILVGTVKEIVNSHKTGFLTVKVKLATDYTKLNTLYLITNLYKTEIDSLKANFKNE